MPIFLTIAFTLILISLGAALIYLIRDKGRSNRTVYALMLRVALSIALFVLILLAYRLGWIHTSGIPLAIR